jgi:hypothetical protein
MDMLLKADWRTGVLEESYRQLAAAWGWTLPKVQRFLAKLEKDCMIQKIHGDYSLLEPQKEGIAIHKSIRRPIHICICNYWRFQRERYTQRFTDRYIHNKRELPLSLAYSSSKDSKHMSAVEEPQPKPKKIYRESNPTALHLASYLIHTLKVTDNGDLPHKPKTPRDPAIGRKGWASTFRLMLNDGLDPTEIKETISWLYGENLRSETSFIVMSPSSLRSKWDRIQIQRRRKDRYI